PPAEPTLPNAYERGTKKPLDQAHALAEPRRANRMIDFLDVRSPIRRTRSASLAHQAEALEATGIWWRCDGLASNALLSRGVNRCLFGWFARTAAAENFMPKITIVETGLVSPERRARHGSFPQMFERLIGEADASASYATVRLGAGGETARSPQATILAL